MAERRAADGPRRIVRCPACGGDSVYALTNPSRPFCSERCRLTDLGAWASEGYRLGTTRGDEEDDQGDAQAPDVPPELC
ncbi:MAG: DNA gyrase inhibitor YacG [Pseudomonadota bacterium]|nr:DNA gyrase inhibitor YacG [Pseudomonadota bacterium]